MAESTANFTVRGIESGSDARKIEAALQERDGVMGVDLDGSTGEAEVLYDEDLMAGQEVEHAVEELGYEVE